MPSQPKCPEWLKTAVFYQLYPQTFLDTNGDGIGDLPGIVSKLDYLASLGVNALWLNPIFESPFGDAGYDVSDFRKVAPRYGTNADLKRLFKEAHKRGIRVLLDLVAGHTSTEHPWFKASRQHEKNKYSDYYIWTTNVWSSSGPGGWITGAGPRDGKFQTNFFWFQPALNYGYAHPDPTRPWEQPLDAEGPRAVRAELEAIMRYWLEAGCDGFRVDMAASLIKGPDALDAMIGFWREIRGWMERDYPETVLVSEWNYPKRAIAAGFHVDFMIHLGGVQAYRDLVGPQSKLNGDAYEPHAFFERAGGGDILGFTEPYLDHYEATRDEGFIALPTGNHDYQRLRRGRTAEELRAVHAMLLMLPGVPFIYYGDEIGMDYVDGLAPKEGSFDFRTGTRTPMQWNRGKNKGFSTAPASKLYTPVDPAKDAPDVESQEKDPGSHLNLIRALLELRRKHPALGNTGDFRVLFANKNQYPFVYERTAEGEQFVLVFNPRTEPARATALDLPADACYEPVLETGVAVARRRGKWIAEAPGSSWGIFRRASAGA